MAAEATAAAKAPADSAAAATAPAPPAPATATPNLTRIPLDSATWARGALYRSCMPFCTYDDGNCVMDAYKRLHAEAIASGADADPADPAADLDCDAASARAEYGVGRPRHRLTVVMLVPDDEAERKSGHDLRAEYTACGFDVCQYDISGYASPKVEAMLEPGVQMAVHALTRGDPVVAHCGSGLGRAAAYVAVVVRRVLQLSGADTVAYVKKAVPAKKTLANDTTCNFIGRFPMRSPLDTALSRPLLWLDGGLATELEAAGHKLPTELWSAALLATDPGAIQRVHAAYFDAGASVATTASYQASIAGFGKAGHGARRAVELMQESVTIAAAAVAGPPESDSAGDSSTDGGAAEGGAEASAGAGASASAAAPKDRLGACVIAGSVGPYGASLADGSEYTGEYGDGVGVSELVAFHRPRMDALLAAGAHVLAIETIPNLMEVTAVSWLLALEFPFAKAWISLCCRDGQHVSSGDDIGACVRAAMRTCRPAQLVGIGVNCTHPEHAPHAVGAVRAARDAALAENTSSAGASDDAATAVPRVLAYPNSGELWDAERRVWYKGSVGDTGGAGDAKWSPVTDDDLAVLSLDWVRAGATVVGGCCRTTPATIRAMQARAAEAEAHAK